MERITAVVPPGTKEALRQISKGRGLATPNESAEIAQAVAAHLVKCGHLAAKKPATK